MIDFKKAIVVWSIYRSGFDAVRMCVENLKNLRLCLLCSETNAAGEFTGEEDWVWIDDPQMPTEYLQRYSGKIAGWMEDPNFTEKCEVALDFIFAELGRRAHDH